MTTSHAPFSCLLSRRAQTPNPILELEYLHPVNSSGRKLDRSIILHFLSMGEFVDAVMQDDFELGVSLFLFFRVCVLFSVGPKRLACRMIACTCFRCGVLDDNRGSPYLVVRAIYVRFCAAHREKEPQHSSYRILGIVWRTALVKNDCVFCREF